MDLKGKHIIYFIGIGGIGMSAIARYFLSMECTVAGYDRTRSQLTDELESEGCSIHFDDNILKIPAEYKVKANIDQVLVIYTPAIPNDHLELSYFKENNYQIQKRSQVLGELTNGSSLIAVAGTHGKTTISTLIAHILSTSDIGCTAFLGGISKNYFSNFISGNTAISVAEADEYDRSFLWLHPEYAIITSVDSDHLDIYKDETNLKKSFLEFVNNIKDGGTLLVNERVRLPEIKRKNLSIFSYSLDQETDFYATNIRVEQGLYIFDFIGPNRIIEGIKMSFPGRINIENAIAAIGVSLQLGVSDSTIRKALVSFTGIKRRFDIRYHSDVLTYIDDYAHHPVEIRSIILSVKELYKGQKLTGIFQPHLYSRTQDLYMDFAQSLDELDKLILLDIYPAREEPIPGVSSEIILNQVSIEEKMILSNEEALEYVQSMESGVLLTLGAGDIDKLTRPIEKIFKERINISEV
ncbi:MAG: UDP-N-acetylmuramate--L-alanine ligase [Bacteroidales bacterium]|nr:UDP-N-acetylmuramate--L-alanine ligase [Bacteroidales bacterium]